MVNYKKENRFLDIVKSGSSYISQIISAAIFQPLEDGAKRVADNLNEKIAIIEGRIIRRAYSSLIIGLGGVFLVLALLFYLKEFLAWSNTAAFFSIGVVIFVIGLMLKLGESRR